MNTEIQTQNQYTHLHLHTEYSTLDGINRVHELPTHIKNRGMSSVAMTDHGNVSGAYKFFKSCKKEDIQPIIGMESYYTVNDRTAREKDESNQAYYHLVLLAQNNEGLHNLFKLSTYAYTEGFYHKPRIDDDLLAQYSDHIIATSSCLGSRSSQLILAGQTDQAEKLLEHHATIFKDRFFIELQLHADEEQVLVNQVLIDLAKRHNWPLLLTGDCHYTDYTDKQMHEIILCMQTNNNINSPNRFSFGEIDVHVGTHDFMWTQAQAMGIPYEAIENSVYIAKSIDSNSYFSDRKNRYPKFNSTTGLPSWDLLEQTATQQLLKKMNGNIPEEYSHRLKHELQVIKKMGFYDYLLIVKELIDGAKSIDVLVGPGRGSAAGSLVAYSLGITEVDPIKYGLVFERFLNAGRSATPLIFDQEMINQIEQSKIRKDDNELGHNLSACLHHSSVAH